MFLNEIINKEVITMNQFNFNTIEDVRKAGSHLSFYIPRQLTVFPLYKDISHIK